MGNSVTLKLEGVEELRQALEAKQGEWEDALIGVVGEAGQAVKDDARAQVPVDSGDLKDSISLSQEGLEADVLLTGKGRQYGQYVEFGTSRQRAKPFMLPAAENERVRLPDRIREAIK